MRKYFITGLLILVPLAITAWVLHLVIGTMDQSLLLVPKSWQPKELFGYTVPKEGIPGLGTILTVLIVFVTGLLTNNLVGNYVVRMWEKVVQRIPIVNSLYSSVKQVSDTLFSSSGNAFRKAVLVPYPHQNSWTIAFLTGVPGGDVKNHLVGDYVSVYVPTTPNPTSGFFLMMKRGDVVELDMSVDVALKYIVSMGVVAPELVPLAAKE
ncbi:putative membrane protein [Oxalobacteraceae bacterium GrIS 1.11]